MFLFEKNFVLKLYKKKFLSCNLNGSAVLRRIPSVVDVKAKIKPKTYVFVQKNFRFKTFQNEVNYLATWKIGRTPSVVVVKAKIKPKTYVFVRKKFRFKTLQNKVFILQSERLCCITSNTISGWRWSKNQTDNWCFYSKQFSYKTKLIIMQPERLCCIMSNTISGWR